ncbi:MGMT family protein [Chitinophaga sp. MM2321]|uniref:MGMT family protein n=1 Tax=Chitinophaga sp. MM2321 TaxID=3137178 RepID=UPI0032D59423
MKKYPNPKEQPSSTNAGKQETDSKSGSFFEVVFKIVRKIPRGRVTSYGAIAEASGIRLTARMVGWAMNGAGRVKPAVPAHRVVNSKGILSGKNFFATPTLMQELLEQEGIIIKEDKIANFKDVFWDPGAKTRKDSKKVL